MEKKKSKYVLLEGIAEQNRFFTTNDPNETEDQKIRLSNGEVAYSIIGYANSVKEAQSKLYRR